MNTMTIHGFSMSAMLLGFGAAGARVMQAQMRGFANKAAATPKARRPGPQP